MNKFMYPIVIFWYLSSGATALFDVLNFWPYGSNYGVSPTFLMLNQFLASFALLICGWLLPALYFIHVAIKPIEP